ncbi:MAG TPA: tetratricopeptide repeat protein [Anaeromyxobacter sp.]|nr:tetratricopeptide repeat protein [Anaeromyxobacter sp.]
MGSPALAAARTSLVAGLAVLACWAPRPLAAPAETPPRTAGPDWPPPAPSERFDRARTLRAEGDLTGARAQLESALVTAPLYDAARLELSDLLLSDGSELDRAEVLLAGVRAPGTHGQLLLAWLAELRGDDAAAAAAYALALEAADDADLRFRRAQALERLGREDEAIRELERVRAARPADAVARGRLAALYEGAGRLREARAEYRALAEARPDRARGWEDLARFCERHGRHAEAREAHARARAARGPASARELRPLPPSRR